jgi:hypothetical protein
MLAGMLVKDPAKRISLAAARELLLARPPSAAPGAAPVVGMPPPPWRGVRPAPTVRAGMLAPTLRAGMVAPTLRAGMVAPPPRSGLVAPTRRAAPALPLPGEINLHRKRGSDLIVAFVATVVCLVAWSVFDHGGGGTEFAVALTSTVVALVCSVTLLRPGRLVLRDGAITVCAPGFGRRFSVRRDALTAVWVHNTRLLVRVPVAHANEIADRAGVAHLGRRNVDLSNGTLTLGRLDRFRDATPQQAEAAVRAFAGDLWAGPPRAPW